MGWTTRVCQLVREDNSCVPGDGNGAAVAIDRALTAWIPATRLLYRPASVRHNTVALLVLALAAPLVENSRIRKVLMLIANAAVAIL